MTLRLIPYLVMDGNAREAIQFYEKALGAEVLFSQTFGEMPEDAGCPPSAEVKERISHAMVKVGETDLMFSDSFPGQPHQSGNQVTICISTDDKEKSKRDEQRIGPLDPDVYSHQQKCHNSHDNGGAAQVVKAVGPRCCPHHSADRMLQTVAKGSVDRWLDRQYGNDSGKMGSVQIKAPRDQNRQENGQGRLDYARSDQGNHPPFAATLSSAPPLLDHGAVS